MLSRDGGNKLYLRYGAKYKITGDLILFENLIKEERIKVLEPIDFIIENPIKLNVLFAKLKVYIQ